MNSRMPSFLVFVVLLPLGIYLLTGCQLMFTYQTQGNAEPESSLEAETTSGAAISDAGPAAPDASLPPSADGQVGAQSPNLSEDCLLSTINWSCKISANSQTGAVVFSFLCPSDAPKYFVTCNNSPPISCGCATVNGQELIPTASNIRPASSYTCQNYQNNDQFISMLTDKAGCEF